MAATSACRSWPSRFSPWGSPARAFPAPSASSVRNCSSTGPSAFPVMGVAVVVASALTGLAVLRMYFSLFCGRSDVRAHSSLRLGLRPREAWTFMALVITLIALGLAPRPLVDSRFAASAEILRQRDQRGGKVLD